MAFDAKPFKILLDTIQLILKRYPMLIFLAFTIASFFPCLISIALGGSFWVKPLDLKFISFDYGAIPLFFGMAWVTCLPFAVYIRRDLAKFNENRLRQIEKLEQERDRALADFWKRSRNRFNRD